MKNLIEGDLTIECEQSEGVLSLTWRGKSAARQPRTILAPYFDKAAALASESGSELVMRFEHLAHFNSSTITVLIQFIQQLQGKDLKLILTYSATTKWQKLSFDALKIFERDDGCLTLRPID